jgi:serine protease AprX
MQALGVSWGERKGRRRAAAALATATAMLIPGSAVGGSHAGSAHASVFQDVIVQALPGALAEAERAVSAAGGKITRQLGVVNGFAATVPSGAGLGASNGVLAVTPDRVLHLQGSTYDPTTDVGAPQSVQSQIGSSTYFQNGLYGQGVGVALIDSGVVPVDGLDSANVFYGPDLTPQYLDPTLRNRDTFGHGTFMASLIAGRADDAAEPYTDPSSFVGVAPEANLVSIKVADAVGTTTESAVVAGVDWAVQHQNDENLNIKVINLSVGVPGIGYLHDPLAAAVERAWGYGITVVAATGNDGFSSVDVPAADPYDIAVGALNSGTDTVASFSNTGDGVRNPDLVAPGTHIVGLRDPGSYIDRLYGSTGRVNGSLFRGSGTSEATAITAGAAALVIEQHPGITPDQVKALLTGSARSLDGVSAAAAGSGALDLDAAFAQDVPDASQSYRHAWGYSQFLIHWASGSWVDNVWTAPTYMTGKRLPGRLSGSAWTGSAWTGSAWTGSYWTGSFWTGSAWTGSFWTGSAWTGSYWTGSYWTAADWG